MCLNIVLVQKNSQKFASFKYAYQFVPLYTVYIFDKNQIYEIFRKYRMY